MTRLFAKVMIASLVLLIGAAAVASANAGAVGPPPRALPAGELGYFAVTPARVLDTRAGFSTVDGVSAGGGAIGPASSINLKVTGRGGIPASGVSAVVLNVTAVNQTEQTFVTAHPAGSARPNAANLNPIPGIIGPNLVIVKVGTNGEVTLYNHSGSVDLVADVQGWYREGSNYNPLTPARIMDSRPGAATVDASAAGAGPTGPGATTNLRVTGRGGIPASGVSAVVVNVTPIGQTAETYVTVFPKGSSRPLAANLNPMPGQVRPNLVIAKVGDDGEISLFNFAGSVNLIVDVQGWFSTSPPYNSLVPARVLDTRAGEPTFDGIGIGGGPLGPASVLDVKVTGRDGVPPSGVGAVVLNVTATQPTAQSFLTVFPKGAPRPNAANLNPNPGVTAPNLVIAKVGTNGEISIYNNSGSVHVIVDVQGWFPSESVANADAVTILEDSAATAIDVRANDTDADGPVTIASVAQPPNGSVVLTGGSLTPPARTGLTYTPNANFCGIDTFVYTLNGGLTATVTVTVTCVDDPPVAVANEAFTAEDTPVAIDVLANDTDIDGGPKTVVSTTNGANGVTTITGGGSGVSYMPNLDFCGGTDTFTYTLNGGSTATVTVTVTCVNDAPVVMPSPGATAYTEQAATVAVDSLVTVTDVDDTHLESARVRVLGGFQAGDSLTFTPQAGIAGLYNPVDGILAFTGSAPKADYQTVLRSVRFASTHDNPPPTKTIQYMLNDGDINSLFTAKTIDVTPVNDPPVITGTTTTLFYTEDDGPVLIQPGLTIADPDSATMAGATIAITNGYANGEELLQFTNQNGITGVFNPLSGGLALSGTATVAQYETAVRSVTYLNGSQDPTEGQRDFAVLVHDGGAANNLSNAVVRQIDVTAVNDAPVVSPTPGNAAYVENDPPTDVDATITVGDVDDVNIVGVSVSIIDGFETGDDVLGITAPGTLTVNYNAGTGVLSLTGNEPVANYQAALRTLTFASTSDHPPATKTLQFEADDGLDTSLLTTKVIDVTSVNDAPAGADNTVITNEDAPFTFTVADFGFTDPSDSPANSMSGVRITTLPASGTLANDGTPVVLGAFVPVADIVAGDLVYTPPADENGTPYTTFTFQVVDDGGTANGGVDTDPSPNTMTINVNAVNDVPSFTAGANQTVAEDSGPATVNLWATGISSGPANEGLQTVSFDVSNNTPSLFTLGAGQPAVAPDGTLTFTPSPNAFGTATVTVSISDNGGTAFGGVDTSADQMFTITVTSVNDPPVVDLNGAGAGNDTSVTFLEVVAHDVTGAVVLAPDATVADVDDLNIESATITITNPLDGNSESLDRTLTGNITGSYNSGTGILALTGTDTLSNYEQVIRSITYNNTAAPPNTTTRTITFVVTDDDNADSITRTATVTVTPLNAPPVIDLNGAATLGLDSSAAFVEDVSGPVQIAPDADVTDADDVNIESATITLTNVLDGNAESLGFSLAGTIIGTYDSGTGIVALTGSDSIANYQTVIRSITYNNVSNSPNTTPRSITVVVNDGAADSNTATSTVSVAATNDAPTLDATKTPVLGAVLEDSGAPVGAVGTLVSSLVDFALPAGQVDNVTDPDAGALLGIAVTAANTANGSWHYTIDGGANWLTLDAVSGANSRLLPADANTRLYFQPNADFEGTLTPGITFRAWDQTSGAAGALIDTSTNGGSTAFSSATDTANITVTGINDAPILDPLKTPVLTAQFEDDGVPTGAVGTLVSTLVDLTSTPGGLDNVTDVDAGALLGVAVTDAATANGSWHYSLDDGANWLPLGAVTASNARLLAADADNRLYFQPTPDFNGTLDPAITFRAWDRTSGTDGSLVDPSPTGGTAAFSIATDTASLVINAVNDAPILDASKTPLLGNILEDVPAPVNGSAVGSTLVSALVDFASPSGQLDNVTDIDAGAVLGIAITGADSANGNWFFSIDDGATWLPLGAVTNANARLIAVGAGATSGRIQFQPDANFNGSIPDAITFRAWDTTSGTNGGTANTVPNGTTTSFSTATDTVDLTVDPVNDPPAALAKNFDGQANISSSLGGFLTGVTDVDSGVNGCIVTFRLASVGATTPAGGTVSITDATAGTVLFEPPPGVTGDVTFPYTVSDNGCPGSATSATATATVDVAGPVIWFVDSTAPAGGNGTWTGTNSRAFNTLAEAVAVDGPNDRIFILNNGAVSVNYAGGIALNTGEWLIGQGATNTLINTFDALMGITPPAGLAARPSIGGVSPTVQGTVTLNTDSRVQGIVLNTGASTALNDPAGAITGVTLSQTSIATTTGAAVSIDQVTGSFTFDSVVHTGPSGVGVSITNSGAGSTFDFIGGITINSGASPGFAATGGGIVVVTDPAGAASNTIVTTTATALNVTNTTIGAGGLTFESISSTGGTASGIILSSTGSTAGLTVTGDGTNTTKGGNASGGTISGKDDGGSDGSGTVGTGIYLNNTSNVVLRRMTISGTNQNYGIYGSNVTGLTLQYSSVIGTNGDDTATREGSVIFDNLLGTSSLIDNSIISGSVEDNLRVENSSGVLSLLTISNNTVRNNSLVSGNVGISLASTDTAAMTGVIDNNLLNGNRTVAIRGDAGDTSTLKITVTNNIITAGTGGNNQGNQGIEVGAATNAHITFDVSGNQVGTDGVTNAPLLNTGINASTGCMGTCSMTGTILNNTVRNAGAGSGFGIRVFSTNQATSAVRVQGNTVSNVALDYGLLAEASGSVGAGTLRLSVIDNDVSVLPGALDAIRVQVRNTSTICARSISGNTSSGPSPGGGFFELVARQANTATFNMEGLTLGPQSDATMETFLEGQNAGIPAAEIETFVATSFTGVAPNACGVGP